MLTVNDRAKYVDKINGKIVIIHLSEGKSKSPCEKVSITKFA